jgi:hypothetical protein
MQMPADDPTAAKLFTMITETDPFQDWARFPEAQGLIESAAPHGPFARVWINGPVEDVVLTGLGGNLPDGSIIVKENLGESTSEKADAWTIMWKVSGYDPDNNDWFWANVTPDGDVNAEGRVEGCITCHGGARENDFVFLHQFGAGNGTNGMDGMDGGPTGLTGDPVAGEALFSNSDNGCSGCHEAAGEGALGPFPNLTGVSFDMLNDILRDDSIAHPGGKRPDFTDEDLADLAAFLAG